MVYHVLSPDDGVSMDVQQRINLALLRALRERGVEFAYPTRTVLLAGNLAEVAARAA